MKKPEAEKSNKIGDVDMYAHYFASKTRKYIVISETNRPVGKEIDVASKPDAKKLSKKMNLKPWNF